MTGRGLALAASLAALMTAGPARAVTEPSVMFRFSSTVTWLDPLLPVPGSTVVSYAGNGTNDAQVRWGPGAGTEPSGYDARSVEGSEFEYFFGGRSPLLTLATFRHINGDAEPAGIAGISLNVMARITGLDNLVIELLLPLPFSHDETANAPNPCPYGGANGQGINSAGCADQAASRFGGLIKVLDFTLDGQPLRASFLASTGRNGVAGQTPEGAVSQSAPVLLFQIESGFGSAVPEPGNWAMLIAGFGLVGAATRRRPAVQA